MGTYLSDEHEDDEDEAKPGAPNAEDGLEGQLVKGVALVLPCSAETDVGEADGAPCEQSRQARELEEPLEYSLTRGSQVDVRQRRTSNDGEGAEQRATSAVDVGEDLWSISLLGKRSERTRATVDAGKTDGDDGEEDDGVDVVAEGGDASAIGDNDEGRGLGVDVAATDELGVGVRKQQADESQ